MSSSRSSQRHQIADSPPSSQESSECLAHSRPRRDLRPRECFQATDYRVQTASGAPRKQRSTTSTASTETTSTSAGASRRPRATGNRRGHTASTTSTSSQSSLEDGEIRDDGAISPLSQVEGSETDETNNDPFLARAQIAQQTILLDIPSDKIGVLAMLPNSVTDIHGSLLELVRKTFEKLLTDALHPRVGVDDDDKLIAFKKLLLAPTVIFTARQAGEFLEECTERCNKIMADDWSAFTLQYLAGRTDASPDEGVNGADAQHRHMEKAVRKYLDIGNLKKGMQRATDSNVAADGNQETLQKLQAKHPSIAQANHLPTRRVSLQNVPKIELHPEDVSMSIRMAAKGAKHGLDKLRSEHLQQLVTGDATCNLLKLFTELCTRIVNNNIDKRLLPFIRDAEIVAARKGANDVRPIVICGTLRKISLAAARKALGFTKSKLLDRQYGLSRSGCERVIATMRALIEVNDTLNVVVLDATNAFNSANRNKAIDMVQDHFPSMMPIVQALYGTPATIWYNGMAEAIAKVMAEVGFQQGCVLGSWLYCLSLQRLINLIIEALDNEGIPFFFIDDGNLVAPYEATLRVFDILRTRGPEFGYIINWGKAKYLLGKCDTQEEAERRKAELVGAGFLEGNVIIHPDNVQQPSAEVVQSYGVTVLGGFIGSDEFIKHKLAQKLEATLAECNALIQLSDLQSRYMLLNWCFKTKIHYWLRCTPLALTEEFIAGFETQKRALLLSILDNNNTTGTSTLTDNIWRIAQLPTKFGGLGLENLKHVRYAAAIASALSTDTDMGRSAWMERPLEPDEPISTVRDYHRALAVLHQVDPTLTWSKLKSMHKRTSSTLQHYLTCLLQKRDVDAMLSRELGPMSLPVAHFNWLNSLQSKEAGLWLTVCKTKGFKLTNDEFQVAILHRCFGVQPSLMPNFKCKCGRGAGHVDERGHHLITGCSREAVRQATHDGVTDLLYNILRMYGVYSRKEVCAFKAAHPKSKKRLDIVVAEGQLGWEKKALLDVTITNPVNAATRNTRVNQDTAAIAAHAEKMNKYSVQAAEVNCIVQPVVFESTGRLHPETIALLKRIAGVNGSDVDEDSKCLYRYWMRMLSITLQKGLASAFMKGRNRLMSNNYKTPRRLSQYNVNSFNDYYVMNHLSSDE